VAFQEALSDEYMEYIIQVQKNARLMAKSLMKKGFNIISGGTDNHLMLIDMRSKNITGKEAEIALGKADITVNKNMVPFDDKSPFVTSGIRVGTAAITTRGITEKEIPQFVDWIDYAVKHAGDDKKLVSLKKKVNKMMEEFPLFA
jgi:glycine hydroxymethyltransferase